MRTLCNLIEQTPTCINSRPPLTREGGSINPEALALDQAITVMPYPTGYGKASAMYIRRVKYPYVYTLSISV